MKKYHWNNSTDKPQNLMNSRLLCHECAIIYQSILGLGLLLVLLQVANLLDQGKKKPFRYQKYDELSMANYFKMIILENDD